MNNPSNLKPAILAFMKVLFGGDGSITGGDPMRALNIMGASPVEVLDATRCAGLFSRGYTAVMASSLGSTLPEFSGTVVAHLEKHFAPHCSQTYGLHQGHSMNMPPTPNAPTESPCGN